VNCPSCGAPITQRPDTEGYSCAYCHAVFFPGEDDAGVKLADTASDETAGGESFPCPLCRVPLAKATIGSIPLLYCTQCHGLLMPMNELISLVDQARSEDAKPAVQNPPDRGDLKRVLQCPRCNRRMDTHFYAGPGNVIVDACDNCSFLWLDRGELTRIAHAPDETAVAGSDW
jgi:Zn-finger nucleic acid-binding protein